MRGAARGARTHSDPMHAFTSTPLMPSCESACGPVRFTQPSSADDDGQLNVSGRSSFTAIASPASPSGEMCASQR